MLGSMASLVRGAGGQPGVTACEGARGVGAAGAVEARRTGNLAAGRRATLVATIFTVAKIVVEVFKDGKLLVEPDVFGAVEDIALSAGMRGTGRPTIVRPPARDSACSAVRLVSVAA